MANNRVYPRIGSVDFRKNWKKKPQLAPFCVVPDCGARATHQPWIEVNWFRGDDERSGPCCKAHSTEAVLLLEATASFKAAQRAKQEAAQARKAAATATPFANPGVMPLDLTKGVR